MATTTPNFGWPVPTSTDLVKDGATAIEALGDSIDASLLDLKGGTSGQVLAKNSNTDMDFVWVTDAAGDITGVTATSPLTGGGTSGTVTVGIQDATTSVKGAVQLTDSISSTSTTTAATPNSVKTSYDLANAAIAKAIVDAKGDLIAATAADTVSRLAVGANGTVLTADSAEATGLKWASAAGGGSLVYVGGAAFTGASSQSLNNVFTSTYTNYMIVCNIDSVSVSSNICFKLRASGTDASTLYYSNIMYNDLSAGNTTFGNISVSSGAAWKIADLSTTGKPYGFSFNLFNPQRTTTTSFQEGSHGYDYSGVVYQSFTGGFHGTSAAYDGITIFPASGTFTGNIRVYGLANS